MGFRFRIISQAQATINPLRPEREMKTTTEAGGPVNWSEDECMNFLRENFGFRGVNGTGITKEKNMRSLENMRKECEIQMKYLEETGDEYKKPTETYIAQIERETETVISEIANDFPGCADYNVLDDDSGNVELLDKDDKQIGIITSDQLTDYWN